jgi:uncharacterized protein DUF6011
VPDEARTPFSWEIKMSDFFDGIEHEELICEEAPAQEMRGKFSDAITARQYFRAGKATVTLVSVRSGVRFTYRLRTSDDGNAIFVGLLNGPDNNSQYKYLGRISRDVFWAGRKVPREGDIKRDAPSCRAFAFAWQKLAQGVIPDGLEIWHEGSCGRCGRRLTVPTSIAAGFGPECSSRMGI